MAAKTVPAADDTITFTCPQCQLRTKVGLDKVGHTYNCRVKCSCGKIFAAEIEFRERTRRQLDLPGVYVPVTGEPGAATASEPATCRVIDISTTGLAFLKNDGRQLTTGEVIRLSFRLDDATATEINQECEVRHVRENFVGCLIEKIDPDLEYYLLG